MPFIELEAMDCIEEAERLSVAREGLKADVVSLLLRTYGDGGPALFHATR